MKVFTLSIDGLPYSFLKKAFAAGKMPYFASLTKKGILREIYSVIPPISSVAWASFLTGVNPGKHGIFGFVEIDKNKSLTIPTASDIKAKKIWQYLATQDKRSIIINIPLTFPPQKIKGLLIAGFLTPSLKQLTTKPKIVEKLKKLGYIIDPEPALAEKNPLGFFELLLESLEKRKELTLDLATSKKWHYFHSHIMETDRLFHFFWEAQYSDSSKYQYPKFWKFFEKLDEFIEAVHKKLPKNCIFLIFSDHGFEKLEKEINLNEFLSQKGYLKFKLNQPTTQSPNNPLDNIDWEKTSAFSLVPGRIYIRDKRPVSPKLALPPGRATRSRQEIRDKIKEELLNWRDSTRGQKIIQEVYEQEKIYSGPYLEQAPDLVALPSKGFDLKAKFQPSPLFLQSHRQGKHTYKNAVLVISNVPPLLKLPRLRNLWQASKCQMSKSDRASILDITPTIFQLMNLSIPQEFQGKSLV